MTVAQGTYPASNPGRRNDQMTRDSQADRRSPEQDAERDQRKEKRETGIEYGANETEQTRERERAPYDKTDEIGELP
jgi:hypothetical protein